MLQRDYILEIIADFSRAVTQALKQAYDTKDPKSLEIVEQQVAELIDLSPETACALAPDSLVTMMLLSGVADSVAEYVSYALERASRIYDQLGDTDASGLRHLQAQAVAESFNCDLSAVPKEFTELEAECFEK